MTFDLTSGKLCEQINISRQRLNQLKGLLTEGIHYIKVTNSFFMYSDEAVKLLNERKKK